MPREPFAKWLKQRIEDHGGNPVNQYDASDRGVGYVSRRTKMDPHQIWTIVNGYDSSGGYNEASRKKGGKKRKLRPVDWVKFETVDKALMAWGDPWLVEELYPLHEHGSEALAPTG